MGYPDVVTSLAARFANRRFAAAEASAAAAIDQGFSLTQLRLKQTAHITGYCPDLPASHSRRLYDLGFAPGAVVRVVRRAPALDPWIYRVAGTEIALRRSVAAGILVACP